MSTPNDPIDQIADAAAAIIQTAWAPIAPSAVAVADVPFEQLEMMQGQQVQIFAGVYSMLGMGDRTEFDEEYSITILAFARYTGSPDVASVKTWIRGQRSWFHWSIFNLLKDPTSAAYPIIVSTANGNQGNVWPVRVDQVISYDVEEMVRRKLFRCDMVITFGGLLPI
jgi:hypothetical protein